MSDDIKQQVVQEFFSQKGLILLENDKNGIFCFIKVGGIIQNCGQLVSYVKSSHQMLNRSPVSGMVLKSN